MKKQSYTDSGTMTVAASLKGCPPNCSRHECMRRDALLPNFGQSEVPYNALGRSRSGSHAVKRQIHDLTDL